jgi:tetratricopeptide (TPR) repeat protein
MYEQMLQDYLEDEPEDPEGKKQHYHALMEETLRQSIAVDETIHSHILLANLLIQQNKNLDEAETLLRKAQPEAIEDEDIISIEAGLAQISENRNQKEEALQHYRTVANLDADFPHIWLKIGSLQRQLGASDEAIFNLRRSVKQEPDLIEAYIELSILYTGQKQFNKARDILRKALDKSPDSVDALASLSMVYAKSGDLRSAQRYLEQAEMIDEQNSFIPIARATLQAQKEQKPTATHSTPKNRHQAKHRSNKNKKK